MINNIKHETKMIPRRDFIYLSVILTVILISVISFFLGDSEKAGGILNFGATAVSIVLAVIAIVMTLIDISGQKNNIFDLKKTADSMNNLLAEEKQLIEEMRTEIASIENLRNEFKESIEITYEIKSQVEEIISRAKDSKDSQPQQELINELEKIMNKNELNSTLVVKNSKSISSPRKKYIFEVEMKNSNNSTEDAIDSLLMYLNNEFSQNGIRYGIQSISFKIDRLKIETNTNIEENILIKKMIKSYPDKNVKLLTVYENKKDNLEVL